MAEGRRHLERLAGWTAPTAPAPSDAEVIALGYMERLRLGMGSPFRLMEYALRDPRLPAATRAPLAWALLDATARGRAYEVDPQALSGFGADAPGRTPAAARLHLEAIEREVRAADDPRAGELAVREAYRLAAAEGTVSSTAPRLSAYAAALARDRETARRDAERLLAHAARTGRHPFTLVAAWRRERRFGVEAPPGAPRPPSVEVEAQLRAASLVAGIRAVGVRVARGEDVIPGLSRPWLAPAAARRLSAIAGAHAYPSQAPVWITVQRYDDALRRGAGDGRVGPAVENLLNAGRTEEGFVAGYASVPDTPGTMGTVRARVALETALALRAYAQEKVWFAGFPAPSSAELERRFGLRSVEFSEEVPLAWRPYYRRMLAEALSDLEEVLPNADLRGASFRFGGTGKEGIALAIHDPFGRVIALPPESGAGTIAHEIGHDFDWQVARDLYRHRAAYGTELAVRYSLQDHFASAVRRMPAPPDVPLRGGAKMQRTYTQRPAEVFARTFDGYVSAMLAARGRSNGYLTAAQDEYLSGYGLALAPGGRGEPSDAFLSLLMVASPVPDATRHEFLLRWGRGRVPGGFELAERVLGDDADALPLPTAGAPAGMAEVMEARRAVLEEVAAVRRLRDSALAEWEAARRRSPFAAGGPTTELSVRRLVDAAAEARVRGVLLRHARALGFVELPAWLPEVWLTPAAGASPSWTEEGANAATSRLERGSPFGIRLSAR